MLAVALIAGLIILLLKTIGAIALTKTWTILIEVICLAIAIAAGVRSGWHV